MIIPLSYCLSPPSIYHLPFLSVHLLCLGSLGHLITYLSSQYTFCVWVHSVTSLPTFPLSTPVFGFTRSLHYLPFLSVHLLCLGSLGHLITYLSSQYTFCVWVHSVTSLPTFPLSTPSVFGFTRSPHYLPFLSPLSTPSVFGFTRSPHYLPFLSVHLLCLGSLGHLITYLSSQYTFCVWVHLVTSFYLDFSLCCVLSIPVPYCFVFLPPSVFPSLSLLPSFLTHSLTFHPLLSLPPSLSPSLTPLTFIPPPLLPTLHLSPSPTLYLTRFLSPLSYSSSPPSTTYPPLRYIPTNLPVCHDSRAE